MSVRLTHNKIEIPTYIMLIIFICDNRPSELRFTIFGNLLQKFQSPTYWVECGCVPVALHRTVSIFGKYLLSLQKRFAWHQFITEKQLFQVRLCSFFFFIILHRVCKFCLLYSPTVRPNGPKTMWHVSVELFFFSVQAILNMYLVGNQQCMIGSLNIYIGFCVTCCVNSYVSESADSAWLQLC